MIEWNAVTSLSWIVAEAYDPETETIYVRFENGTEWSYAACPPNVWEEFTAPGQSRGQYFHRVLKFKPNARHAGNGMQLTALRAAADAGRYIFHHTPRSDTK